MTENQNTPEENRQETSSPLEAPQWSSGGPMDDRDGPEDYILEARESLDRELQGLPPLEDEED